MRSIVCIAVGMLGCQTPQSVVQFDTTQIDNTVGSVRFVICGDTRTRIMPWESLEHQSRRMVVEKIVELDPAFVVNTGDLVTIGDNQGSWATFDALTEDIRKAGIKYVPALGNHEYLGKNKSALENYFVRFPDIHGQKWYAYDAGPVRILILDSNFGDLNATERAAQRQWFLRNLARAEHDPAVSFVVLGAHHPGFTNGYHDPDKDVVSDFIRPAQEFKKARLIVAGHLHSYERFQLENLTEVVSGGCGAPLRSVETDPTKWRKEPAFKGPAEFGHHLVVCDADRQQLSCRMLEISKQGTWGETDRFGFERDDTKDF